jgi:hypothetical protein
MNLFQRTAAAFAAVAFLAAATRMTAVIGFGRGVVIFDSVALVATAICGWIAWRGRLNENQPIVWTAKILMAGFVLLLAALFLLYCWAYKDFGQHDMGH